MLGRPAFLNPKGIRLTSLSEWLGLRSTWFDNERNRNAKSLRAEV
jgi:hypothetical protein